MPKFLLRKNFSRQHLNWKLFAVLKSNNLANTRSFMANFKRRLPERLDLVYVLDILMFFFFQSFHFSIDRELLEKSFFKSSNLSSNNFPKTSWQFLIPLYTKSSVTFSLKKRCWSLWTENFPAILINNPYKSWYWFFSNLSGYNFIAALFTSIKENVFSWTFFYGLQFM